MNEIRIVTVVQARTSSSRLPNKILLEVLGKPLLIRLLERISTSKLVGKIVVATSTEKDDNPIEKLCKENNIEIYRGSLNDLLDRHYQVAKIFNADAVVKIPSDCPLIDPSVIDKVIEHFLDNIDKYDYVSNLHPATYPDGNDVEIISFKTIERAWKEATKIFEREHTTPYIWENKDKFRIGNVEWETGLDYSTTHRWTIDYEEDYLFIKAVYDELYKKKTNFGINDILNLLKEKPYIYRINEKHLGKYWYENHFDELRNISEYKQKREFKNND
ncbi:n-acetylneuraminate cytidylyltransferase [hydrocarbon metagenome]|uniref:N-acetylneuraminate cytidylyltransferase n=1 Tax=hydrocarbon metagenome TaxID=938273 RepID=A0A0W8FZH4_9ZZZZ